MKFDLYSAHAANNKVDIEAEQLKSKVKTREHDPKFQRTETKSHV